MGLKSRSEEVEKSKLTEDSPKKEEKPLDPILEARKRKFESNEIKIKEGIIRLRPKDDKIKEEKSPEVKENELKSNHDKFKEKRPKVEKIKEEKTKQEKQRSQKSEIFMKNPETEEKPKEIRSTTPKPKENIVEVAPATTTTDDSVPDEYKELEKLLLVGDDIDLEDHKVEDIFSDEDSASDNEGRFKAKERKGVSKPPVIPFTKLVNGEKREIKSESLTRYTKTRDTRQRSDRNRDKPPSSRSRTPVIERKEKKEPTIEANDNQKKKSPEKNITNKLLKKPRISYRTERPPPPPVMDKRFERKIEIKIKNPSKYERSGKSKVVEVASSSGSIDRKVNVREGDDDSDEEEGDEGEFEPKFVVENDSDEEYSAMNEGKILFYIFSDAEAMSKHKLN